MSWFWKPYLVDRSIPAILFSRLSAPFGGKSCRLRSFVQPQLATGITWQRTQNSELGFKNRLARVLVQMLRLFQQKKMSEVLPSHRRLCPHWPGLWEPPGGADDPTKSYCCRHYLPAPHIPHGAFHLHHYIFETKSPICATFSIARTEGSLFVTHVFFI